MASLQSAFLACNRNVVNMLVKLFNDGQVQVAPGDVYTCKQLENDWNSVGKKLIEGYWRDTANTPSGHNTRTVDEVEGEVDTDGEMETIRGKHEWIPTNMLAYVVAKAFAKKDIRWIYMAEVLRSPTRDIVALPKGDFLYAKNSRLQGDLGLTGHVGALYLKLQNGKYKARFKAQAKFHEMLRSLLMTYLTSTTSDPLGYWGKLQEHIAATYWQGDLAQMAGLLGTSVDTLAKYPCPYYYLSGVNTYTAFGATMGDMAKTLQSSWDINNLILKNQMTPCQKYTW